jgi:enoyl-[acyl-carrier protein] reductase I
MGFLANKNFLVTGLLSNSSIAYGIAKAMHREGARLAFSYQGEKIKERVVELAAEFDSELVFSCDVASDERDRGLFDSLKEHWDGLDGIVHSIAFAPREAMAGDYIDTAEPRSISHRPRRQRVQLRRIGEGGPADDGRAQRRPADPDLSRPNACFRTTT